jgi:NhaP-type Na+/H+ or K+/H+ antiporter
MVGPLLALARLARLPGTLVLFAAGVALAFVPGLPPVRIDPELLLGLFLPPVLYAATVGASLHVLRFNLLTGVLLGVLLALATIGAVAAAARLLLPGLPWVAALLIGIVVSIFDTRLFHEAKGRPKVPRAIADTLKVREMVVRVVVLSCLTLVLDAAAGEPVTVAAVLGRWALDLIGGAAAGAAIAKAILWLRDRVDPAPIEIAVSVATPYIAALVAEALGISTVVVVMAAALVVSASRVDPETGEARSSSESRLTATTFWEEASLILSSVLFLLIGRALPEAMRAFDDWPVWWLAGSTLGLLATVLLVQYVLALAATVMPPVARAVRERGGTRARLAAAGVMTWGSTRSAVGLLVALSIPATLPEGGPVPHRDLILVVGGLVILASVLLQGLTLGPTVRSADLGDEAGERAEERLAREAMRAAGAEGSPDPDALAAERQALVRLRGEDRIGDEVLRRMLRETDLRERVGEGDALPGAGPPNP